MILTELRIRQFEALCREAAVRAEGEPELLAFLHYALSKVVLKLGKEIPDFNPEIEAMALTACIRETNVVETKLHTDKQHLDDHLMPEFTGTIATLLYRLLKARDYLYQQKYEEVWQLFATSSYSLNCSGWKFQASEDMPF